MHSSTSQSSAVFLLPLLAISLALLPSCSSKSQSVSGYLMYCPCMGRFGNQAEQFLGSLAFAKQLRRTLVVPPWIVYGPHVSHRGAGVTLIPFARYFDLAHLSDGHPTVSMEQFMEKLAPTIWPKGSRTLFCYGPRDDGTCKVKEGSPFGPFWEGFNVEFDKEVFYGAATEPELFKNVPVWQKKFSSKLYPVLALMLPPATFPANPSHLPLQKHLQFNAKFIGEVHSLMEKFGIKRPILAVHLRNNIDFKSVCDSYVDTLPRGEVLFSSYQCFGPSGSHKLGYLNHKNCNPDDATISKDVKRVAERIGANTVFVATDYDSRLSVIRSSAPSSVTQVLSSLEIGTDVFQDVALMALADAALLNCVSSLSAFVRRTRDVAGHRTDYLGRDGASGWRHDEL